MTLDTCFYILLTTTGVSATLMIVLGVIAPRAPELVPVTGTHTMHLDGGCIRYQNAGTGSEALVLLHGFNSQLSIWDDVWAQLGDDDRKIRIDIPGFGGSTWPASSYSLGKQAERVIAFLDAMQLTRVTLVGVSMGGSLAAWIAAYFPDRVKGLVLLAPSAYPGALRGHGLFTHLYGAGSLNTLATLLASNTIFRRLYPRSAALQGLTVTASYGGPWALALEKIRAQTWLLWSCGDACVPFVYADPVATAVRGSTFVRLPTEIGHDIPANRPELVGTIACRVHAPAAHHNGITGRTAASAGY